MFREAATICADDPFTDYVGVEYDVSDYDVYVVVPVELAWKATDGGYECYVYDPTGDPIVGSVEGSGD